MSKPVPQLDVLAGTRTVTEDEMHEIFPETLFFLGNLSDVAVFNYLRSSTFFASFFLGGVRANNGSVAAATVGENAHTEVNRGERKP